MDIVTLTFQVPEPLSESVSEAVESLVATYTREQYFAASEGVLGPLVNASVEASRAGTVAEAMDVLSSAQKVADTPVEEVSLNGGLRAG